jgi:hypothetical protein
MVKPFVLPFLPFSLADKVSKLTDKQEAIQKHYNDHRTNRNAQQKELLLDPNFSAFNIDQVLMKLENPADYPGFVDPRFCLVFWARPTGKVKQLGIAVQTKLKEAFPGT